MDCISCKIINKEIPCYKIYEDDIVLAFLDVNPTSNGHTLIVPKEHTLDITTISNDTLMHIFECSKKISKLLEEKLGIKGFTLAQNNGISQEVKHFHLHIIPKYNENQALEEVSEIYKKINS